MKVDTMRRIDHLAGVPLCFLATVVGTLLGWFRRRPRQRPQRALFIELSEMGSAILVDPAMRRLREQSGAELYFAIFKGNAPSLRLLGTVPEENVFTIRDDGLVPLAVDSIRFLLWTRRNRIDTVFDLELFSRYSALLTGLSGARQRVGYHAFHNEGLYRGGMLSHKVSYNPHIHISKNFLAMVHAVLAEREEWPYAKVRFADEDVVLARATVDDSAKEAMRERVREAVPGYDPARQRLVLINPNASDLLPQRRWMPERYVAVMRRILDDYGDVLVLITGAPAERDEAEGLRRRVDHERCVNFAGHVRLGELPALYSIAALMLSNDSGPGHFSSVTDMPTLVIFGPETPRLYGSLGNFEPIYAGLACSPCVSASNHRKTPCTDNVCLQVIGVDEVFGRVAAVLERPEAKG